MAKPLPRFAFELSRSSARCVGSNVDTGILGTTVLQTVYDVASSHKVSDASIFALHLVMNKKARAGYDKLPLLFATKENNRLENRIRDTHVGPFRLLVTEMEDDGVVNTIDTQDMCKASLHEVS